MRLWILSDLHLEANPEIELPRVEADMAVVAGDVHRPLWKAVEWLAKNITPRMPVVYVAGNHEYFGGSWLGCTKRGLSAAAVEGVHMLHDSAVVIGDVRFVGGTLWTDYALDAGHERGKARDLEIAHAMNLCGARMADHTHIALDDGSAERFQPEHARASHIQTVKYLQGVLADGFVGLTVVVSHHAPYPGSIDRQFYGSPLNPAFCSDLSWLIEEACPAMWVHGHLHDPAVYMVGETLIACNPRGYRDENPAFDPALVLTVPR